PATQERFPLRFVSLWAKLLWIVVPFAPTISEIPSILWRANVSRNPQPCLASNPFCEPLKSNLADRALCCAVAGRGGNRKRHPDSANGQAIAQAGGAAGNDFHSRSRRLEYAGKKAGILQFGARAIWTAGDGSRGSRGARSCAYARSGSNGRIALLRIRPALDAVAQGTGAGEGRAYGCGSAAG